MPPASSPAASEAGVQNAEQAFGQSYLVTVDNLTKGNGAFTVNPPLNRQDMALNNRVLTASSNASAREEAFRYSWLKAVKTTISDTENLRNSLDALREQLLSEGVDRRHIVASSIAITTGLSVGYVIWLVRGGALVGSMLSAMPAWQMIDPLPVLSRARRGPQLEAGSEEDASLEDIFNDEDDGHEPLPLDEPPPLPPIEDASP